MGGGLRLNNLIGLFSIFRGAGAELHFKASRRHPRKVEMCWHNGSNRTFPNQDFKKQIKNGTVPVNLTAWKVY